MIELDVVEDSYIIDMSDSSNPNQSENVAKPCKACTDFKTWSKRRKKKDEDSSPQESTLETPHENNTNCPLNKDDLGRSTWGFLHTMAAYYPENPTEEQKSDVHQFFQLFPRFYPCPECAEDLKRQVERFPPKTDSQHELSQWLCRVHNRINLRLGKPLFDCSSVNERWKDGWKDGSCD